MHCLNTEASKWNRMVLVPQSLFSPYAVKNFEERKDRKIG